jgi:hypothetical protein
MITNHLSPAFDPDDDGETGIVGAAGNRSPAGTGGSAGASGSAGMEGSLIIAGSGAGGNGISLLSIYQAS